MSPPQIFGLQFLLNRFEVQLGAAYFIPTFVVPALLVTHGMMFAMLISRRR